MAKRNRLTFDNLSFVESQIKSEMDGFSFKKTLSVTEAFRKPSDTAGYILSNNDPILLTNRGQPVVAMVPIDTYVRFKDHDNDRYQVGAKLTYGGVSAIRPIYIYQLSDPRDGSVFYVGKAVSPKKRLIEHVSTSEDHKEVGEKWSKAFHKAMEPVYSMKNKIHDICSSGLDVEMTILDVEYTSKKEANRKELEWIKQRHKEGHQLFNIQGVPKNGKKRKKEGG